MSQLIQMRQRIKAVETIKKITHAMRLISMSSHSRLRTQAAELSTYQQELATFFSIAEPLVEPLAKNFAQDLNESTQQKELIILIGSQKGLCGNFNNELLYFFKNHTQNSHSLELILVGKKIKEYLDAPTNSLIVKEFDQLKDQALTTIARELIAHVGTHSHTKVGIISSIPKSFFVQRPTYTPLPLTIDFSPTKQEAPSDYHWYQEPHEIATTLSHELLYSLIYERLLSSLIAEQAARFVAMDASTRNAQNLLDDMKLSYNKLRQSKITRELTDLVGSFFKTV